MKNIAEITYPNTASDLDISRYTKNENADRFDSICKGGELVAESWIQVIKDNKVIAEINERICNIYGEDDL